MNSESVEGASVMPETEAFSAFQLGWSDSGIHTSLLQRELQLVCVEVPVPIQIQFVMEDMP